MFPKILDRNPCDELDPADDNTFRRFWFRLREIPSMPRVTAGRSACHKRFQPTRDTPENRFCDPRCCKSVNVPFSPYTCFAPCRRRSAPDFGQRLVRRLNRRLRAVSALVEGLERIVHAHRRDLRDTDRRRQAREHTRQHQTRRRPTAEWTQRRSRSPSMPREATRSPSDRGSASAHHRHRSPNPPPEPPPPNSGGKPVVSALTFER